MSKVTLLQNCVNFIEKNLKTEICMQEIVEQSCYSKDHLYKLFKQYLGMPINQYIVSRKIKHIAYEHSSGKELIQLVMSYGFNTYAGFYKAFYKWYGCSPSNYKNSCVVKKPQVPNLKTEVFRMHSNKELKEILINNWAVKATDIKPYIYSGAGSVANNVWYINENYVLKKGINIAGLKTHISISNALTDKGFKAATPVKTTDGKDFIQQENYYYYLSNRVPGNWLVKAKRYGDESLYYANCYGEAIAKLHLALKQCDNEIDAKDKDLYKLVADWAIPLAQQMLKRFGHELPNEFYKDYLNQFKSLYSELPVQVIHRDPNPSNILLENKKVTGFVDFEISERNIRLYDLCYCTTGILSETEDKPELYCKWQNIFKHVVEGYHQVNPLSVIELEAIPYVLYAIQFNVLAYLSKYDKYVERARTNANMLIYLHDNMNIIKALLTDIS